MQEASEHLQYLREYIGVLQEIAPRREDLERLYISAHTLSGTSASYGYPRFSEIAAKELGLDFAEVSSAPDVPQHAAKTPRLGLWVPWADTDSIGWIRYSLDQRKVPYTYLRDEDIRAQGGRGS